MKKIAVLFGLLIFLLETSAQIKVKFELQNIPKSKETLPAYFMAGNFNGWKPNDTAFQFKKTSEGNYTLEKELPVGENEFKITRGNWAKVESGVKGNSLGNRLLTLKNDTSINLTVLNWTDEFEELPLNHTASVNVYLLDSVFPLPQLNTSRRIWIYLPPSYKKSTKSYPVIYMHDGQNLFDEFTGAYGEWHIDETIDKISAEGGKESIVIGIDNSAERLKEYNPYDSQYGKAKGKEYVEFLVKTLKPYIDKHYRTKAEPKNTAIAGSSMGGLISMYAIATYPKIFGKAGIFSPAFWVGKEINNDLKTDLPNLKNNKIYFVAGTLEGKTMISDMKIAYQILNPDWKNMNVVLVEKADGEHKEWFWDREFANFYKFITN